MYSHYQFRHNPAKIMSWQKWVIRVVLEQYLNNNVSMNLKVFLVKCLSNKHLLEHTHQLWYPAIYIQVMLTIVCLKFLNDVPVASDVTFSSYSSNGKLNSCFLTNLKFWTCSDYLKLSSHFWRIPYVTEQGFNWYNCGKSISYDIQNPPWKCNLKLGSFHRVTEFLQRHTQFT